MRTLVRIAAVGLLGGYQLLGSVPLLAQVPDPCKPVPLPGLCSSPKPLPSPPGTSPSPKPKPPKGGGGGGETGEQTKKAKKPAAKKPKPPKPPFAVSGPNSTARVIEILQPLVRRGMALNELLMTVAGPFPVAGPAWWTNDWHAPRSGGRVHKGLDIFAPHGTPLVATADGVISQKTSGGLCGHGLEVTDQHGIQYYYCHLARHADGIAVGQQVTMGTLVGYVGNTGNAISTPSHVHFEFQPNGVPHPPKPWVDRWVKIAEQRALAMLQEAGVQPAEIARTAAEDPAFRLTRQFDLTGGGGEIETVGDELLLLSGLQPAASGLEVAHSTVGRMAWEIDWGNQVSQQLAGLVEDYEQYVLGSEMLGLSPWPFHEEADATGATHADGYD